MAWTLDQANVFEGNDGGVGDNPANFTTTGAVASGAHLFVYIYSDLIPTGITAGGNAMQKDRQQQETDFASLWSVFLAGGLASSSTIAVTFSASPNFCGIVASSFVGGKTTSYVDQVNSVSGTSAQPGTWSTSSITPTESNTLVIGVILSADVDSRSTADANFPETHDVREFGNIVMVYRIVADTSAQNPTGTWVTGQAAGSVKIGITVNYKAPTVVTATTIPVARHGAGLGRW